MEIKECPICLNEMKFVFASKILRKYDVNYFLCDRCGLLQTEKAYWLDEAYSSAIVFSDTGAVRRNISNSKNLTVFLFLFFDKEKKYLDTAGGTGLLTRLMRDNGFDFYWEDLYCENVHARAFEKKEKMELDVVTAFEVLEHIEDPLHFIEDIFEKNKCSTFICSTELFNGKPPKIGDWYYYGCDNGQHISFYQRKTLRYIAKKLSLNFYSVYGQHIFTKHKMSPLLMKIVLNKYLINIFVFIIRRMIKSKTTSDSEIILASIENENC